MQGDTGYSFVLQQQVDCQLQIQRLEVILRIIGHSTELADLRSRNDNQGQQSLEDQLDLKCSK